MAHALALQIADTSAIRLVAYRTGGSRHGPITRLMSPRDVGELIKPFIFLDLFEAESFAGRGFAPHPHSGIATLTTFLEGSMSYADSTGKVGSLSAGSVEWMRAGGGVWHSGTPASGGAVRGYQLWVSLPPELELSEAKSQYLEPAQIKSVGPARVVLGAYADQVSPIEIPVAITYLHVQLSDGEEWTYHPAAGHDVAWLALNSGRLETGGTMLQRELAVFAEGGEPIRLTAHGRTEFVIGSAAKHPYPLVSGYYSVHTNPAALAAGEANIAALERTPAVAALYRK